MLKNIMKVLFSNAILTLVGLVNSFIFPVLLSIDEYAVYQKYILYISYVNICHLGIASGMFLNYAGKSYTDTEKAQYKSEIYLIYLVLTFFSIIGLVISGLNGSQLLLCVALTIFPQCIIASFQALYQAWERFTEYSILNALPKIIFTVISFVTCIVFKSITGNIVISIYLATLWMISIYYIVEFIKFTKGVKSRPILSCSNFETTRNGFFITLGNYVNLLFHSIDKQFVNILYTTYAFSIYSFAMSLQSIMTIFITALSNPFYPRLAKGDVDSNYLGQMKEILFIFGSYSGCAYFAVCFMVEHFIVKYVDSLNVVKIFFAVFPAMAVINVLYINLYKIRKKLKKYIMVLIGMLGVSTIFNTASVMLKTGYIGIAAATLLSYYVWLFYSQVDFEDICIVGRDIIYLIGFISIYFMTTIIKNEIAGFFVYFLFITGWAILNYQGTFYFVLMRLNNVLLKRR